MSLWYTGGKYNFRKCEGIFSQNFLKLIELHVLVVIYELIDRLIESAKSIYNQILDHLYFIYDIKPDCMNAESVNHLAHKL